MKYCALLLIAIMIASCASTPILYDTEQTSYVGRAMREEVDFKIDNANADDVWARAQSFVGRFRVLKISTLSESVLQTYDPTDEKRPSLSITRAKSSDSTLFSIRTSPCSDTLIAAHLEHTLSYYMFYGQEPPGDLITRLESDELGLEPSGAEHPLGFWTGVVMGAGVVVIAIVALIGEGAATSSE